MRNQIRNCIMTLKSYTRKFQILFRHFVATYFKFLWIKVYLSYYSQHHFTVLCRYKLCLINIQRSRSRQNQSPLLHKNYTMDIGIEACQQKGLIFSHGTFSVQKLRYQRIIWTWFHASIFNGFPVEKIWN